MWDTRLLPVQNTYCTLIFLKKIVLTLSVICPVGCSGKKESQFLTDAQIKGRASLPQSDLGPSGPWDACANDYHELTILQCGSSTESQVLKRDSMLIKAGTKIEQVTSNGSEWLSVYLTRRKTKGIYFPCHEHQKALTFFGSGEENAEHCYSSSSKPFMPIHFLEHEEVFKLSSLEQSTEGHSESNRVSGVIILVLLTY